VVDVQIDFSRGANNDVIATDDRRRRDMITRIVKVYDQKNTHSGERPA